MTATKNAPCQRELTGSGTQPVGAASKSTGDDTALRRHARRIIVARYFHEMQREQWLDRLPRLL